MSGACNAATVQVNLCAILAQAMQPDRIRLRDIVLADADLIDSWESPAIRGEFNDFGEPPGPMPREVLAAGPSASFGMIVSASAVAVFFCSALNVSGQKSPGLCGVSMSGSVP